MIDPIISGAIAWLLALGFWEAVILPTVKQINKLEKNHGTKESKNDSTKP